MGVSTCEDAAEEAEEGLDSALGCGGGAWQSGRD